jgi:hypothetical protein
MNYFGQDSIVVYFQFNSDQVNKSKLTLIKNKLINEASSVNKICGYTDSIGNSDRLSHKGFGAIRPIYILTEQKRYATNI